MAACGGAIVAGAGQTKQLQHERIPESHDPPFRSAAPNRPSMSMLACRPPSAWMGGSCTRGCLTSPDIIWS